MLRQPKHAMNSGFTEIHRFALLTRRKQRSKRALETGKRAVAV